MEKITRELTDLIGDTLLLKLSNYNKSNGSKARLTVKIESFSPADSVKDRVVLAMIEDAEVRKVLTSGATVIKPTSGNTGIGLVFVAAAKGYRLILTIPDTMSVERHNLLKALGAELVLAPGANGMKGTIAKAEELETATLGSVILQQFEDLANPAIHLRTTGLGIWRNTGRKVDIPIAGVGTDGTVNEAGETPKMRDPSVKMVAVEPADSPVLSGGKPELHKIQGIGAGFIPKTYNASIVDEIIQVQNDDTIHTSHVLAEEEGLLVGISSGATIYATTKLAKRPEDEGKTIVASLPDTGECYLSTILYAFEEYPL